MANNEYKKGFVEGYEKAIHTNKKLTYCRDCKWFSKDKLKCYKPYANRQVNGGDFCSRGVANVRHVSISATNI